MTALWKLGGEGREIVKNDELRIVGPHDVRYRRSRGPKPDLKDPSYWEAKWEYFTDKLVSLLRARRTLPDPACSHLKGQENGSNMC